MVFDLGHLGLGFRTFWLNRVGSRLWAVYIRRHNTKTHATLQFRLGLETQAFGWRDGFGLFADPNLGFRA